MSTTSPPDIMDFFPLEKSRKSQEVILREIVKAWAAGYNTIVLEAPVGSGKSAIAATLARYVGTAGAHVITPRKSLQDQYFEDFDEHLVLMKGRNAYPCTIDSNTRDYKKVVTLIKEGRIDQPKKNQPNCADAPCRESEATYKSCVELRGCPYNVAMELAQSCPVVVHNLHSFIYQSSFGKKFEKRGLLVVDEAHEIENTIRSFVSKKIYLPTVFKAGQIPELKTWDEWSKFLLSDEFVPKETARDKMMAGTQGYTSEKEKYLTQVYALNASEQLNGGFSVEVKQEVRFGTTIPHGTTFEFIPHNVGRAVNSMLMAFGEKVLLMSGTIYNKDTYCRSIGVDPKSAYFIRVGSSFPKENRPIYAVEKYQVDTSFAKWNDNFAEMIAKVKAISEIFHDVKGLIHVPSYLAGEQMKNALMSPRFVTHLPSDFSEKLTEFYASESPLVLLSPVCQQGVDFKDDRARFQIIIRVPFLNTSSTFVGEKVKTDYSWYNYQTLIIFGQQLGRVNRSANDFGATFLLDERFNKFLAKNKGVLPGWVKEAIVYKTAS